MPEILLIDDDEELCEEMTEILVDEGYQVSVAKDGMEGIKKITDERYDIVILDLRMPKISGLEILKMMKEWEAQSKIIVLTGRPLNKRLSRSCENDEEEKILLLADQVINKPFPIETLLQVVSGFSQELY